MSSFRDLLAADLDAVFFDLEEFGQLALLRPGGRGDGVSLACCDSEWQDQLSPEIGGYAGRAKECQILTRLSAARAILGRQPQAGDTLELPPASPRAGLWTVVESVPDAGDGVTLLCRQKEIISTRRGGADA